MLKWMPALALAFGLQAAHANDASIILVDVAGVNPASNVVRNTVKVYGGDTRKLAEVLPVSDVEGGRSVNFASGRWVTSVYCTEQYERPTDNSTQDDWMCSFSIEPRAGSAVELNDLEKVVADEGTFTAYNGRADRDVDGIVPTNVWGKIWSVYGGNLRFFAEKMPAALTLNSENYQVKFACSESYRSPISGDTFNGYMCSLSTSRN